MPESRNVRRRLIECQFAGTGVMYFNAYACIECAESCAKVDSESWSVRESRQEKPGSFHVRENSFPIQEYQDN